MIRENREFELALLVSALLHAAVFGGWQYRTTLGRFPIFWPLAKLAEMITPAPKMAKAPPAAITFIEQTEPEPPRVFMETDETQPTGEVPRDAKYYSDRSTVAANPANPTGKLGDTPYLEGTETRMMSTENVVPQQGGPSAPASPLVPPVTPAPPSPPAAAAQATPVTAAPAAPSTAESPTAPTAESGEVVAGEPLKPVPEKTLAMVPKEISMPAPTAQPQPVPTAPPLVSDGARSAAPSSRREIGAIKSRLTAFGVSRTGIAAFNVAESPFGAYDKAIVRAVQARWYRLIEQHGLYERAGEVTLHFQLLDDGTIRAMETKENTAGQILALFCEKAVVDSAPFEPLPDRLRILIGNEPREVNFTFYY